MFGSNDAGAPLNESEKKASGEAGSGEKKAKRHRRGTRGGQKARAARSNAASTRSAPAQAPSTGSAGRAKTTRTRKPRTTKAKAEAASTEAAAPAPEAPAREPRRAEPVREQPREAPPAAPVAAEPQAPATPPTEPTVRSAPPTTGGDAPAQPSTGTPIRPLGGYRAPVSRSGGNRMSFGGRGGGRHHFRPSGFARPAVPPTASEAGNAGSQQPSDETQHEDLSGQQQPNMPESAGNGPAGRVPPQQGASPMVPPEGGAQGYDEPEGPEPGNELNPPPGRQQNIGGRQQPGFRGPNRIGDRNQGRFGKFPPQQQRGGPRNQGGQPGFNPQGQPRGNQPPRQNWNQQQPRGQQQHHRQQGGQQRGGNQFNGNRQQGGQPRFERGPRQPHQQGMYPLQMPGEQQPLNQPPLNQPLPPQQNIAPQNVAPQFTPVPQPRPQTEVPSFSREMESDTRPLGAPAVPSPVVNDGSVPTLGATEAPEGAATPGTAEHAGNGVDNSALAPFAEDIEIDETPTHPEKRREPTGRDMIINVVEGEEVRIAIVRKGVLEEFYMERASNESHVGNIYKGRVTNVEPSIQAAFVDFGLGKNGFLHISDLHPMYFGPQYRQKFQRVMEKREAERKRQQSQRPANTTTEAFARGDAPAEGIATPPGVPETHLSSDATSAPVLEANESATLGATPAEVDIDAELNAEAPPEVLFDSDDDDKGHTEESGAPEHPAAQSADVATEQPVTPGTTTGETVAMSTAASDAPASFPQADDEREQSDSDASESSTSAATGTSVADSSAEDDDEDLDEFDIDDGGIAPMERVGKKTPRRDRPPIQQCLRRGQEVIVQVTKEGIGTKGPTLTTYVSIPGRALVMMPGMSALGVSRKIEDEGQRRQLRRILSDLNPPRNLGFIIRTAGAELTKPDLQGDLNYLVRMWKVIAQRIRNNKAPIELYQESDLVIRTMRDGFTNEIDRIIVDNEQVASRIRDFLSIVDPRSAGAVELYTGTLPIFQRYNIERQIENIHSRRVELPNGGSLVIDSAEALVAIDVNSGRYREQRDAEMTAFNMNKEAVKEIVRQLRLRDLGGVIVMDFIDMREERHKREIEHMLREHMKHDRAKAKVLRMSQFCMIEMTRQRVRPSIKRSIYMDCPHCRGTALIKTPESVSLDVMRRLAAGATRADVHRLEVRLYPTVANYLLNRKRKSLVELEEKTGKRINISADPLIAGDAVQIDGYNGRDDRINLQL